MDSPYGAKPWTRHYDYWVPPHLTYPRRALTTILDTTVVDLPDAPAVLFLGATLTYRQLKDQADRLACALVDLGVVKGDRIGIMLPNCPQYVIAAFAILRTGAIIVNLNPTYTPRELTTLAGDADLSGLITLDALAPLALGLADDCRPRHVIVTSLAEYSSEGGSAPSMAGTRSFSTLIANTAPRMLRVPIGADDIAVLQYTGGTTGTPKGAMLSHANIFANVVQTETYLYRTRTRGDSRYLLVIPCFHIYAFTVGMMKGVWVGARIMLMPKYDVEQVLTAIRDFRPTYFPAVPTIYVSLLNHPKVDEYGLDRVRTFNSGGAPCPVDVIERFERTTGRQLNEGYGLSETSPTTMSTPQLSVRKPGTIGIPMPDTDVRIVDVETGTREVPIGEPGELCVSGPQVMQGYWRKPDETARALRIDANGRIWFHTGDIARMDDDGFLSIVQRKKDMIIVDGFNVYPSDVESVLYAHPAVRLAAVIGLPDSYHGEVVKACVVLQEPDMATCDEILAHCRGQLAPYKVPKTVEIRESLPMSAVGKILYRVLREEQTVSRSDR